MGSPAMKERSEIERLIRNATDSFDGKPWYGTSTQSILARIPYRSINTVPDGLKKSIATILRHMLAWRLFAIAKLKGEAEYRIPEESEENWNFEIIKSEEQWEQLLQDLEVSQAHLLSEINTLSDEDLDKPVPGSIYNKDYLIRGIIQHDTFHLGQIALLIPALK